MGDRLGIISTTDDLTADCANCFALCCVALAFVRSADFGMNKAAGEPCSNLTPNHRCGIHSELRSQGFKGCTVFDCFGAGQRVSQHTFAGRSWQTDPAIRADMFSVFSTMRQLHELLWYLLSALEFPRISGLQDQLIAAAAQTHRLTLLSADEFSTVDPLAHINGVWPLLTQASQATRAAIKPASPKMKGKKLTPGVDLVGAHLRHLDLRGVDLSRALLIAAELQGCDLRGTDLLGADLRDAQLAGANLSEALFLTQVQVNSAQGSTDTKLPTTLSIPSHWQG